MLAALATRHTPATGIAYRRSAADGTWRHVDTNDGRFADVGPHYQTKGELMADHERYLRDAGWMQS